MILVWRARRSTDTHEADAVRRRVGERVKPVRQDADRAARIAERNLREGDAEIQDENADQDA
jgi:predicted DNA-binding protein (UPF0278 family)